MNRDYEYEEWYLRARCIKCNEFFNEWDLDSNSVCRQCAPVIIDDEIIKTIDN